MKTDDKIGILIETEERVYVEIDHIKSLLLATTGEESLNLTKRLLLLLQCLNELRKVGRNNG